MDPSRRRHPYTHEPRCPSCQESPSLAQGQFANALQFCGRNGEASFRLPLQERIQLHPDWKALAQAHRQVVPPTAENRHFRCSTPSELDRAKKTNHEFGYTLERDSPTSDGSTAARCPQFY